MQASKFCRLEMSWAGADLELAKTAVSRCCFGRHAAAVLLGTAEYSTWAGFAGNAGVRTRASGR